MEDDDITNVAEHGYEGYESVLKLTRARAS